MPSSPVSIPPLDDNALVVVFGGSGFLGRHIVRRLAKANYRIRVAMRRPNEALFVKTCGRVGQVEIVAANIRDDASVAAALEDADAVVNTVGILYETGRQKFDAVQAEGAARLPKRPVRRALTGLPNFPPLARMRLPSRIMRAPRRRANRPCRRKLPMPIFCAPLLWSGRKMIFSTALPLWPCWHRPCR